MKNLGGTTPWALALSTVLLGTSVGAQEIGRGPEGKKKVESPSIASVDESLLGCSGDVVCCLGNTCQIVASNDDCASAGGSVISYKISGGGGSGGFASKSSFPDCGAFEAWDTNGCVGGPVSCCMPTGATLLIEEAHCLLVGGVLGDVFTSCPDAEDWMENFVTGLCLNSTTESCTTSTKAECDGADEVFHGFPREDQLEFQPRWVGPTPLLEYDGYQWTPAQLTGDTSCEGCEFGEVPDGDAGTWITRGDFFFTHGPVEKANTQTVSIPRWEVPAGYTVTGVRVALEGGVVIKVGVQNVENSCGIYNFEIGTSLVATNTPELGVVVDRVLVDRPIDTEGFSVVLSEELAAGTFGGFIDASNGALEILDPTNRPMIAFAMEAQNNAPAAPGELGVFRWDSSNGPASPGGFGLDIADWVGVGPDVQITLEGVGVTGTLGGTNGATYFKQYSMGMVTVCYDYEPLPPVEPCECPEEDDLHLRETNASVLAMPKVDLRWAYTGPSNPTPSDLKDADNYELEQDTILQLTNDFGSDVRLQVILANGDGSISAVNQPGTVNDFRAHPGWNQDVFDVRLTGNQPQVASFAAGGSWSTDGEGTPDNVHFRSFTVLDEADSGVNADEAPGRPASASHPFQPNPNQSNPFAGPYDRELRGFAYVIAVQSTGNSPREINWNHLDGIVTVINYADTSAWTYRPVGLRALNGDTGSILHGSVDGANGLLKLDDEMYAKPACEAVFGFQAQGSASFGSPGLGVNCQTSLELVTMPVVGDFRPAGSGQDPLEGAPSVQMQTRVWNENEIKFEEDVPFQCWNQYSDLFMPEIYTSIFLETDMGKARICAANAGGNYLNANSKFGLSMSTFPLFTTRAHHLVYSAGDVRPVTSAGVTGRHVGRLEGRIRYAR